jgi:hypothetical protein
MISVEESQSDNVSQARSPMSGTFTADSQSP